MFVRYTKRNRRNQAFHDELGQLPMHVPAILIILALNHHPQVSRIDPAKECQEFGVLLIGDTGTGKSTLINNLLGEVVAPEGDSTNPETSEINPYRATVKGVKVALYDTPGKDGDSGEFDKGIEREIKNLIQSRKVCLTIFCFSMNEMRLRRSHIANM